MQIFVNVCHELAWANDAVVVKSTIAQHSERMLIVRDIDNNILQEYPLQDE